jgi:CHAT domain-containing protein
VNRVYIASDGAFDLLPWDALPSTKGADFLIEDVEFTQVIHGSLLTEQLIYERNIRDKDSIDAMVVGSVDFGDSLSLKPTETLSELPDSDQEVKCFEDVFRAAGVRSIVKLTGDNAQVEEVVDKLKRTQYAHFATHMISGVSKSRRSSDSIKKEHLSIEVAGIALANSNLSNDGFLRASRIAALPLGNTCMVNLAGCYSAAGDPSLREIGVSSLEHAFQLAGVQVTVSSKWEVDSTITSYLMSDFYTNLFSPQVIDVSSSLRAAKIRTMRQGPASDSGHPFYWAGWQVTGSPFLRITRHKDSDPSLKDFQGGATSSPALVGHQGRITNSQNFRWSDLRFLMHFRIPIAIVLLVMSGSLYLAASWNR